MPTVNVSTIAELQTAVANAQDGDTIVLAAGTYTGQVTVSGKSNLTITAADGADVTIEMPNVPQVNATTGKNREAVIAVENSDNITIENINVDGRGLGSSNAYHGIFYGDASGVVDNVDVTGIRAPLQGNGDVQGGQIGRAIASDTSDSTPRTLTVSNSTVTDFQKTGIDLRGEGLTVTVTGNTIEGMYLEQPNSIAQNGITIYVPGGVVSGNDISEIGYTRTDWMPAGILI